MATAGTQIFGDHYLAQIDQDYTNFLLAARGTLAVSANAPQTVSLGGMKSPLLCVRPTGALVGFWGSSFSGGVVQWTFRSMGPASVDWYVFDAARPTQDLAPGRSVYRADGSLAYNSNQPLMNIRQVSGLPAGTTPPADAGLFPAGSIAAQANWAACITTPKALVSSENGALSYFYIDGIQFVGAAMHYGPVRVGVIEEELNQWLAPAAPAVLFVDTSNLN